ncbi:MAG TPA: hypothetical protein VKA76_15630 [Gammaproteobacteria bacterium]|nr:hypothetical protein [Gammaproteobacteria bacterium]
MAGRTPWQKISLALRRAAVVAAGALLSPPWVGVQARDMATGPFAGLQVASEQELAERRGGFDFAGMTFKFGARVRTVIDGQLALQSTYVLDAGGQLSGQQSIGAGARALDAATAAQLVAAGLQQGVDAAGAGVIVQDAKGSTLAVHDVSQRRVIGLLANTASDRRIQQQIDVTVSVARFKQFQQAVRDTLLSNRIGLQTGELR